MRRIPLPGTEDEHPEGQGLVPTRVPITARRDQEETMSLDACVRRALTWKDLQARELRGDPPKRDLENPARWSYPIRLQRKGKKILDSLRAGNYPGTAARQAGVSDQTLRIWMQRGQNAQIAMDEELVEELHPVDEEYRRFYESAMRAIADEEAELVEKVRAQADTQWTAAMTLLERRHPERWRRRTQVEQVGEGGGPVKHEVEKTIEIPDSPERLAEVLGVLAEAGVLPPGALAKLISAPEEADEEDKDEDRG